MADTDMLTPGAPAKQRNEIVIGPANIARGKEGGCGWPNGLALLSELTGMILYTVVAVTVRAAFTSLANATIAVPLATGFGYAAGFFLAGSFSSGFLNPILFLGVVLLRNAMGKDVHRKASTRWWMFFLTVVTQFVGGLAGVALVMAMDVDGTLGLIDYRDSNSIGTKVAIEAVGSYVLYAIILFVLFVWLAALTPGSAARAYKLPFFGGVAAVGTAHIAVTLAFFSLNGGLFNPAIFVWQLLFADGTTKGALSGSERAVRGAAPLIGIVIALFAVWLHYYMAHRNDAPLPGSRARAGRKLRGMGHGDQLLQGRSGRSF